MPDSPALPASPQYTILGSGRWARILVDILAGMGRQATMLDNLRSGSGETAAAYRARLVDRLSDGGQIVWIAVPPGPHSITMVEAALDAGQHVIVEKPWQVDPDRSRLLDARAAALGLRCAVHFQYLFLTAIQELRAAGIDGGGMVFSGQFTIARGSRSGIAAGPNLGSHLVALWRGAFPAAARGDLAVGYEQEDRRMITLEGASAAHAVDFTENAEPIVQRFVAAFEAGAPGPIGLALAAEIGEIAACL